MSELQAAIENALRQAGQTGIEGARCRTAAGGDIHRAWILEQSDKRWFVKLNRADRLDLFTAEADALREMQASGAVRVPTPYVADTAEGHAFLAMEWLPLSGGSDAAYARLGEQLAALHGCLATDEQGNPRHGWHRDNWIGTTAQPNPGESDWVCFYREHRLRHQVHLARHAGGRRIADRAEELAEHLPALFSGYTPPASMLHGDLWGGNAGVLETGEPVLYDPALYYGDRETDLAMTELFGGFPRSFHNAYQAAWPLDPGYPVRRRLYQLYHVLNHYNLFGGGYLHRAEQIIDWLIAQAR